MVLNEVLVEVLAASNANIIRCTGEGVDECVFRRSGEGIEGEVILVMSEILHPTLGRLDALTTYLLMPTMLHPTLRSLDALANFLYDASDECSGG